MGETLGELTRYRDVLYTLVWRDIRVRYKQSVMGIGWAVLMPLVIVGAGVAIRLAFSTASGTKLEMSDVASLAVKSAPYGFLVAAVKLGTMSLIANQNLLTKVYVPRLIFPLAAVFSQLFDFAVASAFLTVFVLVIGTGVSVHLVWLPVLLVLLLGLAIASAVLLSAASLFFRDVKYLVDVLVTFAVFFVPVFYDAHSLGRWEPLVMLNPVSPVLEAISTTVVGHAAPDFAWLGYSVLFMGAFLWLSVAAFGKLEPYFAESV